MATEKQSCWQETRKHVLQMTDKLGMPVDKRMIETVTILKLLGLHTTMSCSGHMQRITGGPYVAFISPKAEKYRERCKQIDNPKDAQYKKLYQKALRENILELQKLYHLLEQFYAARNATTFGRRLSLRTHGFSASRLDCQGADLARIVDRRSRKQMLADSQAEMKDFTEYLKRSFFESKAP